MAITDSQYVDLLVKKVIFGAAKTDSASSKSPSNETIASPLPVYANQIWAQSGDIPPTPPASSTSLISVYSVDNSESQLNLVADTTSSINRTFLTNLTNWIPPSFGPLYAVKIYIGDPTANGTLIVPAGSINNDAYIFDYQAGVLHFPDTNVPVGITASNVWIEGYRYIGDIGVTSSSANVSVDGFTVLLGNVAATGDGSWSPGAIPLTNTTPVSEAIDQMNEVLSLLVPAQPPAFPNSNTITITSVGSSPLLANGVSNNTGTASPFTAGAAVSPRITTSSLSSVNTFQDMGPGNSGTISLLLNGSPIGSRTLTGIGDVGTYGGLVISDQKDFPVGTPGFWRSIDTAISGASVSVGINRTSISHSGAGSTPDAFFVYDAMTSSPSFSSGALTQSGSPTFAYSSSVPHYGDTTATIAVGLSISNLAGETYYGGADPLTVSGTNAIIASQNYTYATMGITTPIDRQTTAATPITPVSVLVNGTNIHNSGNIQAVVRNVNGASVATNVASATVLVKRGTTTSRIDELAIPVTITGTTGDSIAQRISSSSSADTPSYSFTATTTDWNPTTDLATFEAAVVAGLLGHNVTNYATGFLPIGPNLSIGRSGAQYITFWFRRTPVSKFDIRLTTGVSGIGGCWVKMVGQESTSTLNGWFSMATAYAGTGAPGEGGGGNGSNGCAVGGVLVINTQYTNTNKTVTFGTLSSASATNNSIMVRFRLNSGQTISALSFLTATN